MDFPHLQNSNSFPHLSTIDTFGQYKNTFDYERWTAESILKPCNVRWTIETDDRPYWADESERDSWFDSLSGNVYELTTTMDVTPENTVKLPIPYATMQYCNYLMVTVPVLPGDGTLDYGADTTQRYFYFVRSVHYLSPNTTECELILDDWTTWIYRLEIPRIMTERGHVGMSYESVDDYLDNPIEHTHGLTMREPDEPAMPTKVTKNQFIPLGRGALYAVVAFRCSPTQASHITQIEAGTDSDAAYSDYGTYDGDDYVVDDYSWGAVPNLNSQTSRLTSGYTADNIRPNGYGIAATLASNLQTFLSNVNESYQTLWGLIECVYIVPADMLRLGTTSLTIGGVTFYRAYSPNDTTLADLTLSKTDFDYPDEYTDITKLYTSPYAWLSVSDANGNETTIAIENTTNDLGVYRRVSLIYPYLQAQTFLQGVGGNGSTSYTWQNIADTSVTTNVPDSGVLTALITHEIPTYALMADSVAVWNMNGHSSNVYQARQNAINSYHIGVRSANTGQYNTEQTNATNVTNTAASNSTSVSNTQRSNNAATTNTTRSNTLRSRLNTLNTAAASDLTDLSNDKLDDDTAATRTKMDADLPVDQSVPLAAYNAQVEQTTSTNVTGTAASIAGAVVGVAAGVGATVATGGAMAPVAVGAAANLASTGLNVAQAGYNVQAALTSNQEVYNASNQAMIDKRNNANTYNNTMRDNAKTYATDTTDRQNDLADDVTEAQNNASTDINATSVSASNSNASASAATSNANAERNADTSNANAGRSRHASVLSSQTTLTQAQRNYQATVRDLERSRATDIATPTGSATLDIYGTRGVQVRVMTQSDGIVRRMGDMFLRYGYTLHENVESPDLNVMKYFTYWQGDPTVYGQAPTTAVTEIKRLFNSGVTVWRDPSNIGHSIYDNIEG